MSIRSRGLIVLLGVSVASVASADEEWLFCNSCSTPSQFESYAISRIGAIPGEFKYYVANANTGRVQFVEISATVAGNDPALTGGQDDPAPSENALIADPALSQQMTYTVIANFRQSAQTEAQFIEIVTAAKASPYDHGSPIVLPDNPSFGSYAGRNQGALRDYMWQHGAGSLFTSKPGSKIDALLTAMLAGMQALYPAIAYCYIFNNGDVACFKWPTAPQGAAPFVPNTAKNSSGQPIGGSGNDGYDVHAAVGGSYYGPVGYASNGSFWLFCGLIAGKVTSCHIQWLEN